MPLPLGREPAGQTLILYNDAPAAFPARVANYDYYTGAPDTGAGVVLPGYGPNTRTVMQVRITENPSAAPFNLTALRNTFKQHADGSGVFEDGQHPIIVGQAAYNSAYGTNFANSGDCTDPNGTNKCDGYARINQQGGDQFRFDNLKGSNPQLEVKLEPKAIHDEMNSTAFDEFGRMTANLGLEAVPATPAGQNVTLYPYVAPPTEVIDGTNLPKGDLDVQAISDGSDGTQIWKITHNGVDTHPIHFHLYDVRLLNRVTWDNIIKPPDPNELGWKDTVRVGPLEETIVALRPIIPTLPFEIPNSIRPLDPMMPLGENIGAATLIVDPDGNISTIKNALVNFGWEYVYHCHILSHEEMDMMRPVLTALPPFEADGLTWAIVSRRNEISWNDNSITETSFILQRSSDGITWTNAATSESPLDQPNTRDVVRSLGDTGANRNAALLYRVVARNTVGYGGAYPVVDADSTSAPIGVNLPTAAPAAPTNLRATLQTGPRVRLQCATGRSTRGASSSSGRPPACPARSPRSRSHPPSTSPAPAPTSPSSTRRSKPGRPSGTGSLPSTGSVGSRPCRSTPTSSRQMLPLRFLRHRASSWRSTRWTRAGGATSTSPGSTTRPTRPGSRSSGRPTRRSRPAVGASPCRPTRCRPA